MGIQVALPRLGNGIQSVFNQSSIKPILVMGRLEMGNNNFKASSNVIRRSVGSQNARAAQYAVETPTLLSVTA